MKTRIFITTADTFQTIVETHTTVGDSTLFSDGAKWDVLDYQVYSNPDLENEEIPIVRHYQHPFPADEYGYQHEVWSEITPGFNSATGNWDQEGEIVVMSNSGLGNISTSGGLTPLIRALVWQMEKRLHEGFDVAVVINKDTVTSSLKEVTEKLDTSLIIVSANRSSNGTYG